MTPTGALAGLVTVVWMDATHFQLDLMLGASLAAAHKGVVIGVTAADGKDGTATASTAAEVNAFPVLGAAPMSIRGDVASRATDAVVPYTDDGATKSDLRGLRFIRPVRRSCGRHDQDWARPDVGRRRYVTLKLVLDTAIDRHVARRQATMSRFRADFAVFRVWDA